MRPLQLDRILGLGVIVVALMGAGPRPLEASLSRVRLAVVVAVVPLHRIGGGADTLTVAPPPHQADGDITEKCHREKRGGSDDNDDPRRER